jgi:hypothetical protein
VVKGFAIDQIRHGLQSHVGMGSDIETVFFGHLRRSHVVGEAPRAHRAMSPSRERPANGHGANRGRTTGGDFEPGHATRLAKGARLWPTSISRMNLILKVQDCALLTDFATQPGVEVN